VAFANSDFAPTWSGWIAGAIESAAEVASRVAEAAQREPAMS
jgi:monoamine oxidase